MVIQVLVPSPHVSDDLRVVQKLFEVRGLRGYAQHAWSSEEHFVSSTFLVPETEHFTAPGLKAVVEKYAKIVREVLSVINRDKAVMVVNGHWVEEIHASE